MRTTLIRMLAVATLASSMSAFAATDEPKHDDPSTASAKQQDGCADRETRKQQKAKSQRDQQHDQNEKEFEQMLMGIYG